MARRRKKTPAEAAANNEQMEIYSALLEEAELARKAAEAAPTAEELQAAQRAADLMQQAPTAQELQEAQEMFMTQEEIQQYTHRPLSEIEKLPAAKRELVWNEIARQLTETPGFADSMSNAIAGAQAIAQQMQQAMDVWRDRLPQIRAGIKRLIEATIVPAEKIGLFCAGIQEHLTKALTSENMQALQTFATLAPYIKAEAEEHPEKYGKDAAEPASAGELIKAAAARAREDGKEIPQLAVETLGAEQLEMDLNFPTDPASKEADRQRRIEEARQRREQAQSEGVFETTSSNLATIAEKGLGFSYFTSEVIKGLPGGVEMKDLMLDAEGKINLYDLTQQGRELEEVDSIHTGFLMWLLGLAYHNSDLRETNSNNPAIPVNVPAVLAKMNIDPRPRLRQLNTETNKKELVQRQDGLDMADLRRDKFMEFLRPFLNMAAFFGEDLYQIVGFQSYNKATETIQIAIPYLFKLVEYSKLHATRHGAIVNIFHADIMTENQTAVEVANRIAMGVLLRGLRPDMRTYKNATTPQAKKTVQRHTTDKDGNPVTVVIDAPPRVTTWAPKFASLIKDCPQFEKELDAIRTSTGAAEQEAIAAGRNAEEIAAARKADHKIDPQRINKKLKDVFDAAIRIIMEKSDMPEYYAGFTIKTSRFDTFKPPTSSSLNDKLIITHKGKNPHYHE